MPEAALLAQQRLPPSSRACGSYSQSVTTGKGLGGFSHGHADRSRHIMSGSADRSGPERDIITASTLSKLPLTCDPLLWPALPARVFSRMHII